MRADNPIRGVFLSRILDLESLYGSALSAAGPDVAVIRPEEVTDPEQIRFAICWLPEAGSFAPYPNLKLAMSIGAGVDDLLGNPELSPEVAIARVRDPHQAALMAGYATHEVLHVSRHFAQLMASAERATWEPLPMNAPETTNVAILGNGTMGEAVARVLRTLGFTVRVACRTEPARPLDQVSYFSGSDGILGAVSGAHFVINVLPLTHATENVLNGTLFTAMASGSWLIQIGRGEHLVEDDLLAALDSGQLAGATLDVFHQEPLPADHPFWQDDRLRITPHIASDSVPSVVAEQIVTTARQLRDNAQLSLSIERARGY
ncbi:NAD(P)-dependent oxidoreductase [Roseovarius sp. D0-M9]|uniref:NAD(P)-dependent oxidoreductase n=1 Tax=Roseovarius sp. D0-M9 TaxID=3127117 RepID=UPI00301002CA